ncbi:MAG: hypothetical protein GY860_19830 [Desulfobacteraceae bacterium]|nr:hypothetical protein [Desulfobacteraceae bacterium]
MALAIFAIGILGVATLQISSTKGTATARKVSEASEICQEQIESLMAAAYSNVVDGNIVTADGYKIQWTVLNQTDIDGDGSFDFMTVQVVVNDPRGRLRSLLSFTKTADI